MSIFQKIISNSERHPNKVAVFCASDAVSYRNLLELAYYYSDLINKSCDSVLTDRSNYIGILMENSVEFLGVFLGAIHSDYIPAIYNSDWSEQQLENICNIIKPHLILVQDSLLIKYEKKLKCKYIVVNASTKKAALNSVNTLRQQSSLSQILFIGFTSGSTNLPKGFIRNERSWLQSFEASSKEFSIDSNSMIIAPGPLAHGFSLYAAMEAIINGASVYIQKKFDLDELLLILQKQQNSHLFAIPTMLKKMLVNSKYTDAKLTGVTFIVTSAEKLQGDTVGKIQKIFTHAKIIEYYGASELGFISVRDANHGGKSVGRPFTKVEIKICHKHEDNCGEIWVKSPFIMDGYLTCDETEANYRKVDDWATVGDLGFIGNDNLLYLLGRKGDMIITGGYNVYPSEIEDVLRKLPWIENGTAYVLGLEDANWGTMICAVLKLKAMEEPVSKEKLKCVCRRMLPSYKIPKRFFVFSNLPTTSSGKISKKMMIKKIMEHDSDVYELR